MNEQTHYPEHADEHSFWHGTSSGAVSVQGNSGAKYYGFCSPKKTRYIKSILITCSDPTAAGFAVGEFVIG